MQSSTVFVNSSSTAKSFWSFLEPPKLLFLPIHSFSHRPVYSQQDASSPPVKLCPSSSRTDACHRPGPSLQRTINVKLLEAPDVIRSALQALLPLSSDDEVKLVSIPLHPIMCTPLIIWRETVTSARDYLLGVLIEIERRRVIVCQGKRTKRTLWDNLQAAIVRCWQRVSTDISRFLLHEAFAEIGAQSKIAAQVKPYSGIYTRVLIVPSKQHIMASDRYTSNAVEISYDEFSSFEICALTFTTPLCISLPCLHDSMNRPSLSQIPRSGQPRSRSTDLCQSCKRVHLVWRAFTRTIVILNWPENW
ncbi:LOW QUALITY PROTEIN: hypothetical protein CVT26_002465 [Gymnopilus dilepis]|uniref:Uncharacterized protein n=1 Tax=Gymnopilus dilepis TaxID=231916 RepID=A0A409YX27_9AGAR|nr:LOW QUALITY PROTEIN: hypothetical protein CVT26_002465 [Gymnopilus dilepis]